MPATANAAAPLAGIAALCERLYAEAMTKGATDAQALKAVKLAITDHLAAR